MDQDELFLRMILDRPDDDGPRLVFADWLEERGDCDRAELIRLQCLGGDETRVQELIRRHGRAWAGPASRHTYALAFRRGLVEEVTMAAPTLLRHGEEVFARYPVRLLRLIGTQGVLDRLIHCPLLDRVNALHLTGSHLADEGAAMLASCPYLMNLRTLRLGCNAIGDAGAEALADSPFLEKLETLVLHGNLISDSGAVALATTHPFASLKDLDLSDNLIGDAGAEALARCPAFPSIVRLDLSNQFKGWADGLALRGRPYPIQPAQQAALTQRYGPSVCVF